MNLDVITLYKGLENVYGPDAITMSTAHSTTVFNLVAPDGSPLTVGWFNDSARRGLPGSGIDTYAATAIPPTATSIYHRQVITQRPGRSVAVLREEDDSDGMDWGLDGGPTLYYRREVAQPHLGAMIRSYMSDALVLSTDTAAAYTDKARQATLRDLRAFGLVLRAEGNGLGYIDNKFLDSCATIQ